MDASNYVAATDHGTYVVVINGVAVAEFVGKEDAERAYNVYRGIANTPPSSPGYPEVTLDCSHGQGAPVNGGCWCCIDGTWQTDPKFCADPDWRRRCGNSGGGSAGTTPQPGAPTSPESGPTMPGAGGSSPAAAQTRTPRELVASAAAALHVTPEQLAAGAILAAVFLVR